ncbi:MAG: hypothetical protein LUQ27_03695 [Methanomassiliicoccales archaeon]|nr:hypothetical protein [Methanomassiliicoccales archaeon]
MILLGTALALITSGCLGGSVTVEESFENGLVDWTVGKDLPVDPNTGDPIETSASISEDRARTGSKSLSLSIDGRQDDGTVWVQLPIAVSTAGTKRAQISFYVFSETESFNVLAQIVAYANVSQPSDEADFEKIGQANPAAGWNKFEMSKDVEVASGQPIYVAIGITVAWETILEYEFDDVRITIS